MNWELCMCTSVQSPAEGIWSSPLSLGLISLAVSLTEPVVLQFFCGTGGQQDPVILLSPTPSLVVTGVHVVTVFIYVSAGI